MFMYKYFMENPVVAVVFIVVVVAIALLLTVKVARNAGFEKIRKAVYLAFVVAENNFNYGDNKTKFEYVVNTAKEYLPAPFKVFITEKLPRQVIQEWFTLCKDLLDDGKVNNSQGNE